MTEFSMATLSLAAFIFAASAAGKLRGRQAYRSFRGGLAETALLPRRFLPAAAAVLASAEAAAAAGLAAALVATAAGASAKPAAEAVLTAAITLTAVLAAGVARVVRRGTAARCHCFGARPGRPLGPVHLTRNLTLLGVLAAGLVASMLGRGDPAAGATAVAVTADGAGALLFTRWEEIAGLFAPVSVRRPAGRAMHRPGPGAR